MTTIKQNIEQQNSSEMNLLSVTDKFFRNRYSGFKVVAWEMTPDNKSIFKLEPTSDPICPGCRKPCSKVHAKQSKEVQDSPLFHGVKQYVQFNIRRVRCDCGCCQNEYISWLKPQSKFTNLCIGWIQSLLTLGVTPKNLSEYTGISRETINQCNTQLQEHLHGHTDLRGVRHLIVDQIQSTDETSGENQWTTIFRDAEQKKVVWIASSPLEIYKFRDALRKWHLTDKIGSICYDVMGPLANIIQDCFSNTKTLYDPYQLLMRFRTDLILVARRTTAEKSQPLFDSALSSNRSAVRSVGGFSWVLNRVDQTKVLDPEELLRYVMEDNNLLSILYPISQMVRQSWEFEKWDQGRDELRKCQSMLLVVANKFNFPPAEYYANLLKKYEKEILNNLVCDYSMNRCGEAYIKSKLTKLVQAPTNDSEGLRNKYYKIRSTFPGKNFKAWEKLKPGQAILETQIWEQPFPVIS